MAPAIQQHDRTGDSRARELFHYFQPDNPAMLPTTQNDANLKLSAKISKPDSPNLVLTALAQLAAIKVQAQRAIISLIDRETLYVVAEASRSLNLANTDLHDDFGDGLWMGCSNGPMAGTLCEETIALKPSIEQPHPVFTVKDLKEHPIYCKIPCVAGRPHFRFYAGTPLKTTNGVNIGSLYVIDPQPDLTLTLSHKQILGNIADAVMEYMETSRQSLEANRLTRLLAGLNTFVQGQPGSDDWSTPASPTVDVHPDSQYQDPSLGVLENSGIEHADHDLSSVSTNAVNARLNTSNGASASSNRDTQCKDAGSSHNRMDKTDQTFQHAAQVMRESLDLGSHGGVIIVGASEGVDHDFSEGSDDDRERKLARVWAISHLESKQEKAQGDSVAFPAAQMDSHFVRRMIRCHPRGGLWYFQDDASFFSSDEDGASSESSKSSSHPPTSYARSSSRSLKALREKDFQALKKYFPDATRIIFSPLWDSLNSRWFGACFCWSRAETRVFSTHVDLGGLFGFGSLLMVEHSRIRSQESAIKKGDFISTISHEMRSPLHGILGASEFLSEHIQSEFGLRLLDTVRACGQTLLDTFEQILDFTKINSFEKRSKRPRSPLRTSQQSPENSHKHHRSQSYHLWKLVNIAGVVEDAVESIYAGQVMSRMLSRGSVWNLDQEATSEVGSPRHEQVDVIIDVASQDWLFFCEAGALRRIVMNVFGNALKYTEKGSITLNLGTSKSKKGLPVLVLTVSDTGKGISHDYLHSKIFTPFSQEDSLSPGAGLGLSLVRDILQSLNGSITIKSQLGIGTVVRMTLPILDPQHTEVQEIKSTCSSPSAPPSDLVGQMRAKLQGKTVQFIQPGDFVSVSFRMIGQYLIEWLGMRPEAASAPSVADLIVVDEHDLDVLANVQQQSLLLVLCRRRPKLWQTMTSRKDQLTNAVWLTLPCGPHQLARTLHVHFQTHSLTESDASRLPGSAANTRDIRDIRNEGPHNPPPGTPNGLTIQTRPEPASPVPSGLPSTPTLHPPTPSTVKASNENTQTTLASKAHDEKSRFLVGPGNGLRILLVEDNAINLALLRKFISRLEPQILHTAVDGAKAVEMVQEMADGYQYILMDLSMPVMDGFEATRRIRSIETKKNTAHPAKIIALTGLGSSEHIKRAYAAGVNVFLRKPFSFKDIIELFAQDSIKG